MKVLVIPFSYLCIFKIVYTYFRNCCLQRNALSGAIFGVCHRYDRTIQKLNFFIVVLELLGFVNLKRRSFLMKDFCMFQIFIKFVTEISGELFYSFIIQPRTSVISYQNFQLYIQKLSETQKLRNLGLQIPQGVYCEINLEGGLASD